MGSPQFDQQAIEVDQIPEEHLQNRVDEASEGVDGDFNLPEIFEFGRSEGFNDPPDVWRVGPKLYGF